MSGSAAAPEPYRCREEARGADQSLRAARFMAADQTGGDTSQHSSFYSWYYLFLNIGAIGGESVCPLMREHVGYFAPFGAIAGLQARAVWMAGLTVHQWGVVGGLAWRGWHTGGGAVDRRRRPHDRVLC